MTARKRNGAHAPEVIPDNGMLNTQNSSRTVIAGKLSLRKLTEQALLHQISPTGALVNGRGDILYLHGRTGMYLEPTAGKTSFNNILQMAREGFRRQLPRWANKIGQARPEEIMEHQATGGDETILLVEDEAMILKMVTTMLHRLGYSVLPAPTPVEALRLAGEFSEVIHLLVTDVIMPEINGRDLAKQLLVNRPDMKCLFMSGYSAKIITAHGVQHEAISFLQKPFSYKKLACKVREVLTS